MFSFKNKILWTVKTEHAKSGYTVENMCFNEIEIIYDDMKGQINQAIGDSDEASGQSTVVLEAECNGVAMSTDPYDLGFETVDNWDNYEVWQRLLARVSLFAYVRELPPR